MWPYQAISEVCDPCDPSIRSLTPVTPYHAADAASSATGSAQTLYVTTNGMGELRKDGGLYAFDASNGALQWCVAFSSTYPIPTGSSARMVGIPPPPRAQPGSPTVAHGVLYVSVGNGGVFAFDAASGEPRWQRQLHDLTFSPHLTWADGALYFGSVGGGVIYALDAASGAIRWQQETPAGEYIGSPPAVVGDTLYASSYGSALYALDATTGMIRWSFATTGRVYQSAVVVGDTVYIGAGERDGHIYAVDARSGELRWKYATGGIVLNGGLAVANGLLYVNDDSIQSFLHILDGANGAVREKYALAGGGGASTPIVTDSAIYLSRQGVLALDAATGATLWRNTLDYAPSCMLAPPLLAGSLLYVASDDGKRHTHQIIVLDAATGAQLWSIALPGYIGMPTLA